MVKTNEDKLTLDLLFTNYESFINYMIKGYIEELVLLNNNENDFVDLEVEKTSLYQYLLLKKQLFEDGYKFIDVNNIQDLLFSEVHRLAIDKIKSHKLLPDETVKKWSSGMEVDVEDIFNRYMIKCMRIRERLLMRLEENPKYYFIDATFEIVEDIAQLRRTLISDGYDLLSVDMSMHTVMEIIYQEVSKNVIKRKNKDLVVIMSSIAFTIAYVYVLFFVFK